MGGYVPLAFRTQTVTIDRPGVEDDGEPSADVSVGTLSSSVREITADIQREFPGTQFVLGLRVISGNTTLAIKPRDIVTVSWLGTSRRMEVISVRVFRRSQQLTVGDFVGKLKRAG